MWTEVGGGEWHLSWRWLSTRVAIETSSVQTHVAPSVPHIWAPSTPCFRHLCGCCWSHLLQLLLGSILEVDAFLCFAGEAGCKVCLWNAADASSPSPSPSPAESLILEGSRPFSLPDSGANSFLHSTLPLTLGRAFVNKVKKTCALSFHLAYPPHEARALCFNRSGIRRTIPKEKNIQKI